MDKYSSVKNHLIKNKTKNKHTSLPRTLQAQTLSDATPPTGKIHLFNKFAVTFKLMMPF